MRTPVVAASLLVSAAVVASATVPESGAITSRPLGLQQKELRTSINAPSGRQPRLAIPPFLVSGSDPDSRSAAATIAEVLWKDLEFEREFQMISPSALTGSSPVPWEALAYDMWREVGADDVLVGSLERTGATLQVDIRVVSVERRASSFAKRYGCPTGSLRLCAHTIADELHKERFGLDGVARTKIAFASDRDTERASGPGDQNVSKEIYISDYDGERVNRVTSRGSLNLGPAWAPDGRAFAYQSYQTGFADIFVQKLYDPQASPHRPAQGTEHAQNYLPAWSPDGNRLAFASSRDGDWEIYVVNLDGTNRRRLTSNPADDGAPTWSPSGSQIAFTSDRTGTNQIYIMSADGGPAEKLTDEPMGVDRPTWSRDNVIAYTLKTVDGTEIKTIDVGTRQSVQLTDGPGTSESPSFAPNGRHLVFVTTRWGKQHIAVIDVDGQNVRQITFAGNNRFPTWSPGPQGK